MKRARITTTLVSALLISIILKPQLVQIVQANPFSSGMKPAPTLPSIIIDYKGNINPANSNINKNGKLYNLTGNITDHSIEINCDNITLNGAGFTLSVKDHAYASSSGIIVNSNGVIIQNMNLLQYKSASVLVLGSNNTITENNIDGLGSGIELRGSYNDVIRNTIHTGGIILGGDYNKIIGNSLSKDGIFMFGSIRHAPSELTPNFTTIVGNTITGCIGVSFGVYLSVGTHFFYLNNFVNNTNGNVSPFRWQLTINGKPVDSWTPDTTWLGICPDDSIFDNGILGNYWSDYEGIDANQDGIGDTPYVIGGILKDRYPLMTHFDINRTNIEMLGWVSALLLSHSNLLAGTLESEIIYIVDTQSPVIAVLSPENKTYSDLDIIQSCQFNEEVIKTSYSLDGFENITFTGDIILSDLSPGDHQLIVYAQNLSGDIGASETIVFTIKPDLSILVMITLGLAGIVGLGLIIQAMRQKEET
jgi:nitrous oxidase accessory protein NosD